MFQCDEPGLRFLENPGHDTPLVVQAGHRLQPSVPGLHRHLLARDWTRQAQVPDDAKALIALPCRHKYAQPLKQRHEYTSGDYGEIWKAMKFPGVKLTCASQLTKLL